MDLPLHSPDYTSVSTYPPKIKLTIVPVHPSITHMISLNLTVSGIGDALVFPILLSTLHIPDTDIPSGKMLSSWKNTNDSVDVICVLDQGTDFYCPLYCDTT